MRIGLLYAMPKEAEDALAACGATEPEIAAGMPFYALRGGHVLCIGGGVCNEGDPLLVPMKEIVKREVYTRNSEKNTEIVIAALGNDAGIIGAAFLGNAQD